MQSLVIIEFLQSLNLGEQVMIALILGIIVLYLFRARSMSRSVVGMISTAWLLVIGALAAIALGVFMGWFDPHPVAFLQDVLNLGRDIVGFVLGPIDDWLLGVVG